MCSSMAFSAFKVPTTRKALPDQTRIRAISSPFLGRLRMSTLLSLSSRMKLPRPKWISTRPSDVEIRSPSLMGMFKAASS